MKTIYKKELARIFKDKKMIFSVFLPRRALLATRRTQKPDENGTDSVIPNRYTPALSDIFYPPK